MKLLCRVMFDNIYRIITKIWNMFKPNEVFLYNRFQIWRILWAVMEKKRTLLQFNYDISTEDSISWSEYLLESKAFSYQFNEVIEMISRLLPKDVSCNLMYFVIMFINCNTYFLTKLSKQILNIIVHNQKTIPFIVYSYYVYEICFLKSWH